MRQTLAKNTTDIKNATDIIQKPTQPLALSCGDNNGLHSRCLLGNFLSCEVEDHNYNLERIGVVEDDSDCADAPHP